MEGKVAVVTGGAQGLGRGFAEWFLKQGLKVCICDVNTEKGEETLTDFKKKFGEDRVVFTKCNVTSESDVKAAFDFAKEKLGPLDIVVNNAGISHEGTWNLMVDVNLKGVIHGTLHAIEAMRKDKGGNGGIIVNVASAAGLLAVYLSPVYAATKWGVIGFTKSWAQNPDCTSMGLRFMNLCPTFADTAMAVPEEGKTLDFKTSQAFAEKFGVMPVQQVVDAFEKLITLPDNNGVVMAVSNVNGARVVDVDRDTSQFL